MINPRLTPPTTALPHLCPELSPTLLSIVQPVETRCFANGIWQHFPNRRKWYQTTDEFYVLQGDRRRWSRPFARPTPDRTTIIDLIGPDQRRTTLISGPGLSLRWRGNPHGSTPDAAGRCHRPDDPRVIDTLTPDRSRRLAEVWNNGRTANDYQPISRPITPRRDWCSASSKSTASPAAYGRAIVVDGNALLCDVNTFPNFRRRGLGHDHHGVPACSDSPARARPHRPHRDRNGTSTLRAAWVPNPRPGLDIHTRSRRELQTH